ncbi:MAG: SMC-Scp complex subunit ScpB [Methylobacterium sp.]|nr:SMC-Scp complex subunit ScpB [Methylobacterium sp.]MCA3604577.1 SMC-Scp complex subunit ScpB [Methylobacterium sp.]MCA3614024.1 SMC-Scp complex subunit ScpB [Methylobacterium sp.]MCA4909879.1 SMC-Scp complex subunit ScpB [Methylobacterium sp.]
MSKLPLRPAPVLRTVDADDETIQRFAQGLRIAEALLFASPEPLAEEVIARMLPQGVEAQGVLAELAALYHNRGVNLLRVAGKWMFRTAPDLGYLLRKESHEERKLGRAALETLAIIAYHQPVTRAEIEELRGVSTNKGTIDALLEGGFIRLRGRRRTPGRPVTFGTTETFLIQFGLDKVGDLPSLSELAGMGMADPALSTLAMPLPTDDPALRADEDPLEPDLFDTMFEERLEEAAETPPLDPDGADVSAHRENPTRPRPDPDG